MGEGFGQSACPLLHLRSSLIRSAPHVAHRQATAKDTSIFKHLTTSWALTPQASTAGRPLTKVDLYLAYAFISPFHAAAVSSMWEKVSGMMIGGFEKRVGDVYGR